MIYTVKEYYVANNEVISDEDIKDAIDMANKTGDTIRVTWSGPGWPWYASEINAYHLTVEPGSDINELKKKLPKIYGV